MKVIHLISRSALRVAVIAEGLSLVALALAIDFLGFGAAGFGKAQWLLVLLGLGTIGTGILAGNRICSAINRNYIRGLTLGIFSLIALIVMHFPLDTDGPPDHGVEEAAQLFYEDAYAAVSDSAEDTSDQTDSDYVDVARDTAEHENVEASVAQFVDAYGLRNKRVLEVGAGSGTLQDLVEGYVGLDISENARRFFHKPFVQGSATALPFRPDEFDAIWTIWTLEHVPNPEQALAEMRRVVKNGGLLFLQPAWNCPSWAAEGYQVRPYSDFDWWGKAIKASILIRSDRRFDRLFRFPTRVLRAAYLALDSGPTRLRYRKLEANFDTYWVGDSDAVNSIDSHEAYLWFKSRGDRCLNCESPLAGVSPLIIEVQKPREIAQDSY